MSYEVIARKWRPQTFDEVRGQNHVTTPLRNAVRTGRVAHAILLAGPRGTGKTTLARILARCLNCEKGPTETPCGACIQCREISSGRSTDVQEIDAASRTGVDDAREITESIRYAAAPGKHRIFIIDEVHMLSKAAFNALLKTIEEPPPSSLFIFATTDPDKIPATILSRCQRYDLRRIAIVEVVGNLRGIADAEGITISDTSLRLIAREGDGSMRDAQTLFDQVLSYGGKEVADETVTDVLDLTDRRVLVDILRACVESNPAAALAACGRANTAGSQATLLGSELVQLLRDLVVLRLAPDDNSLVEGSDEELVDLRALAESSDLARLRRMFRSLVKEQEDLAWAPQPFAVLEMAVVRLATMPAGDDVGTLLARLDALEKQLRGSGGGPLGDGAAGGSRAPSGSARGGTPKREASDKRGERGTTSGFDDPGAPVQPTGSDAAEASHEPDRAGAPAEPDKPDKPDATAEIGKTGKRDMADKRAGNHADSPREPVAPLPASGITDRSDYLNPAPTPIRTESTRSAPLQTAPEKQGEPSPNLEPASSGTSAPPQDAPLSVVFDRLRGFAQRDNRGLFASLEGGQLLARDEGSLRISLRSAFHAKRLRDRPEELDSLCRSFFGRSMQVEIEAPDDAAGGDASQVSASPSQRREEARRLRHEALNHPAINIALEELKGQIVEIRPLGENSR